MAATPFTYEGHIGRIWGGDNFEVSENGRIHYVLIRGIDTPEPGQKFHDESKAMILYLATRNKMTMNVLERDDWKREVCDLRLTDPKTGEVFDPSLELLKKGMAWFDQSDGPYAEAYREAEALAREKKIGLWSQPNPVPPWEFWERQVEQIQGGSED